MTGTYAAVIKDGDYLESGPLDVDITEEHASLPVIVEAFDPLDAMRDAYDATCATRDAYDA